MATAIEAHQVLNAVIADCDVGKQVTIRHYLVDLLGELWRQGECFSAKRPFGNSGWEYPIYVAMIANGLVPGELDDYGCVCEIDEPMARRLIAEAIQTMKVTP